MKETNKFLTLLMNYTEDLYKIMYLIKKNTNVYKMFLLNLLLNLKLNLFYKHE